MPLVGYLGMKQKIAARYTKVSLVPAYAARDVSSAVVVAPCCTNRFNLPVPRWESGVSTTGFLRIKPPPTVSRFHTTYYFVEPRNDHDSIAYSSWLPSQMLVAPSLLLGLPLSLHAIASRS